MESELTRRGSTNRDESPFPNEPIWPDEWLRGNSWAAILAWVFLLLCVPCSARELNIGARDEIDRNRFEVRITLGLGWFLDPPSAPYRHRVIGGSLRIYLSRRFALEPQFLYRSGMKGVRKDVDSTHRYDPIQHSHLLLNAVFRFTDRWLVQDFGPWVSSVKFMPHLAGGIGFARGDSSGRIFKTGIGTGIRFMDHLSISPEVGMSGKSLEGKLHTGVAISGVGSF